MENICQYLYDNRSFYINALKFTGQNSFYEYFGEVIYQILKVAFAESFGEGEQSDFNAMFFADALRACICRWLTGGARMAPRTLVEHIRSAFMQASSRPHHDFDGIMKKVPWT